MLPKERGVGYWNLAEKFVQAGDKLRPPAKTLERFPICFLFGHGIELALKAFLISQGVTEKALRDIGHDLSKALLAARLPRPGGPTMSGWIPKKSLIGRALQQLRWRDPT